MPKVGDHGCRSFHLGPRPSARPNFGVRIKVICIISNVLREKHSVLAGNFPGDNLRWSTRHPTWLEHNLLKTAADVPQKRKQQRKTFRPVRKTEADLDINALGQKHVASRNQFYNWSSLWKVGKVKCLLCFNSQEIIIQFFMNFFCKRITLAFISIIPNVRLICLETVIMIILTQKKSQITLFT